MYGDQKDVQENLKEKEPFKQKQLGKDIKGYNPTDCYGKAPDLILPLLIKKFKKNSNC